jgi:Flp pilus assembly protein TadG
MKHEVQRNLRRLAGDEGGAVTVITAVSLVSLIGMSSLAIDYGYVRYAQAMLQASADAAAMAGATEINVNGSSASAAATAISYSSGSGGKNAFSWLNSTVTTSASLTCLNTLVTGGYPCLGSPTPSNAIVVTQKATVPLFIGQALGFQPMTFTATATAAAKGGGLPPMNIEIILDSTNSMGQADSACPTASSQTKIGCATQGIQMLLGILWPSVDNVGLMTFPPVCINKTSTTNSTTNCPANSTGPLDDYNCSGTNPGIQYYGTGTNTWATNITVNGVSQSPYVVVPLSAPGAANYKTSMSPNAPLNFAGYPNGSYVVNATGYAANKPSPATTTCKGIATPGGDGTYYAQAIYAAQAALTASSQSGVQNVIILFSDGAANSTKMPSNYASKQCQQGITAAQAAAAAGTWVYTIAYGSPTSTGSSGCSTDTNLSPCSAMQQMASDPTKFYSDDSQGCLSTDHPSLTSLNSIFQNIGNNLRSARLVPNGTT